MRSGRADLRPFRAPARSSLNHVFERVWGSAPVRRSAQRRPWLTRAAPTPRNSPALRALDASLDPVGHYTSCAPGIPTAYVEHDPTEFTVGHSFASTLRRPHLQGSHRFSPGELATRGFVRSACFGNRREHQSLLRRQLACLRLAQQSDQSSEAESSWSLAGCSAQADREAVAGR